jgi:hypothetical protein
VNAPVGIGKVDGMGFEVMFPSIPTFDEAVDRLDLPLVSPELFAGDFGAVVFAINSSFSVDNDNLTIANYAPCLRAHQKDETQGSVYRRCLALLFVATFKRPGA